MCNSTKQCGNAAAGTGRGPAIADPYQLVAEPSAVVDGCDIERLLDRHAADEYQAAQHVGRESGAFFVGEERHRQSPCGAHRIGDERLGDLEPGEHTEVAVEASPGAHGVDVRAGHHRCQRRVAAVERGEHVADLVDLDA